MLQPNEKRVGELYTDLLYVFNVFAGFIVVYTNCNLVEKGQVAISFSILFLFDNIELVNWFKLRNVQI